MRTAVTLLDKYPGPVHCTANQHRLPVYQQTRNLLPLLIIEVKSVGVALPMKKNNLEQFLLQHSPSLKPQDCCGGAFHMDNIWVVI